MSRSSTGDAGTETCGATALVFLLFSRGGEGDSVSDFFLLVDFLDFLGFLSEPFPLLAAVLFSGRTSFRFVACSSPAAAEEFQAVPMSDDRSTKDFPAGGSNKEGFAGPMTRSLCGSSLVVGRSIPSRFWTPSPR